MLGSVDQISPKKNDQGDFFAIRKGLQTSPHSAARDAYGTVPNSGGRPRMVSMKLPDKSSASLSQGKISSGGAASNVKRRMTELGAIPNFKDKRERAGQSTVSRRKSSFAEIEEETEHSRHDEYGSGASTKKAVGGGRRRRIETVADD